MEAKLLKVLFGRRVRSLRQLKDITQEQFAELTNVSAEYVSKIERGLASPSFDVLARMCDILEVSPKELFDFSDLRNLPDD